MTKPLISVILPTYNGEKTIKNSIESILNQEYKNFELIIINDGSTDKTAEIIKKISDPRIKTITQKNFGLPNALNTGIKMALGKYIARQDQDDFSHSSRFSKQIELLEQNPNIILVGTWARILGIKGEKIGNHKHPITNYGIKTALLIRNPFVHSSVMIRKDVLLKAGLYETDENLQPPEDYELWCRISNYGEFMNIPSYLVEYLYNPDGLSSLSSNKIQINMNKIVYNNLKNYKYESESELKNFISMLYPTQDSEVNLKPKVFYSMLKSFNHKKNSKKLNEMSEHYSEIIYIVLRYLKSQIRIIRL